ncbi:40S ribosomal protein S17 [Datura stramonium]|uniref:40S ribosomal protein S17 n=1 Tax=Datura stramonium TaxID=4076 RepID=A0ABS8UKC5_DATST|nr:40S ribosomal protein S17 [Datura stramonium]
MQIAKEMNPLFQIKKLQQGWVVVRIQDCEEAYPDRRSGETYDFVPDESAIKTDLIEVDKETLDMLSALGMSDLPGVVKQATEPQAVAAALPTFGRGAGGFGRKY